MNITKQLLKDSSLNTKIVVDFYADWCKPCQLIKPVIEEAEKNNEGIKFIYINVDEYDKDFLKKQFGVIAIPNIQFWFEGVKRDFAVGNIDEPAFISKMIGFAGR